MKNKYQAYDAPHRSVITLITDLTQCSGIMNRNKTTAWLHQENEEKDDSTVRSVVM